VARGNVRIGCSGWNYSHWRNGVFYPPRCAQKNWLSYYSRFFDTVEINSTFYRLPSPTSATHWLEQTPDDFLFAVKVSRYLTHVKRLRELHDHLGTLLERLGPLAASPKLGPFLWQLPPTFRRDDVRLAEALGALPTEFRHAFEFRHESWFCERVYDLLRSHNVALVIADRPEISSFQTEELTADFTFLRFHSGLQQHGGDYVSAELRQWATKIHAWSAAVDVLAYFNNDWNGYAIKDALELSGLLEARQGLAAQVQGGDRTSR
jgi:uncharacterized protein YecE (DUF72 family)